MLENLGLRAIAHGRGLVRTTMGKLTTHVLDLVAGIPAAGMRIELHDLGSSPPGLLAERRTNEHGRCLQPLLEGDSLHGGRYRLTFHVAEYFRSRGAKLPEPPFIDEVAIAFGVANPGQDYHVPLLVSPWSYSTYRGS
jgi:5-hydroxyisourate hydrolase